jgi:hypothetical protein
MIPKISFDTSYYNQYDASPSGKLPKVQSNVPTKMKGRNIVKEVTKKQTMIYTNGQTIKKVTIVQQRQ